jgi:KaiC/GvpD/RAD55 family RecA-like ATPase
MELPAEQYFEANVSSVKTLTGNGFEGVYVSFQRPFNNISSLLKQQGININKLFFVDVATAFGGELQEKSLRCIHISQSIDIDELVRAIYTSLDGLKGKKKFIFIDSLTTLALYKPLSETMRFSEFLMLTAKKHKEKVLLVFNVAKDLAQKKFIKDVALHVDEVISIR